MAANRRNCLFSREERYQRNKAQQLVADRKRQAVLERLGQGVQVQTNSNWRIETRGQYIVGGILLFACFATLVTPVLANSGYTKTIKIDANESPLTFQMMAINNGTLNALPIEVAANVNSQHCSYIQNLVHIVQTTLPESKKNFDHMKEGDFALRCVSKAELANDETFAKFDAETNQILYPALTNQEVVQEASPSVFHHETIHAGFSATHNTKHCNTQNLPKSVVNSMVNEGLLKKPNDLKYYTPSPIWPPTRKNLLLLNKLLDEDIADASLSDLPKRFKENPQFFKDLFKGSLIKEFPVVILIPQEQLIVYKKNPEKIPKSLLWRDIYFTEVRYNPDANELQGKINDPISNFLYQKIRFSDLIYNKLKKQNQLILATGEREAHLLTGIPEAAVKYFFPRLFKHLERNEACCVRGEESQCYKP